MIVPPIRHLYVHVPFCPTVCPFCSFEVTERRAGLVDACLRRLEGEAEELGATYPHRLDTLYFGGGTPSHLRDGELETLMATVRGAVGWADEVTLEVHPATVSRARLERWIELGVTRLSVGVESVDDNVLATLGRGHDGHLARRALDLALDVASAAGTDERGMPRVGVSADVMTAIDGQDVRRDLGAVAATGVDHVSAYTLTVEPGTPFAQRGVVVDPDAEAAALDAADEVLGAAGLRRYEVSNHARPGHECRHNLAYWDNAWWSALGPGASSHLPPTDADLDAHPSAVAVRATTPDLARWLTAEECERDPRDAEGYVADGVLAGLRRLAGVDLAELGSRVGLSGAEVVERWGGAVEEVEGKGWVTVRREDGRLEVRPTSVGMVVLDQVASTFLDADQHGR